MAAYLNNVFLIDEISICGEDLDQIKVRTVISNSKTNIFAKLRLAFVDKTIQKEYTFKISECSYTDNHNPENTLMKLQLGDLKFYAHKSRSTYCNDELVKAVLHPDVTRIKTLN